MCLTKKVDHLVFAVEDLLSGMEFIRQLTGVQPILGGQHKGLGTWNAILALGNNSYLEIIAPDPEQPEPANGRWMGLSQTIKPGLIRWAAKSDNIEKLETKAKSEGFSLGKISEAQRTLSNGAILKWKLSDPDENGKDLLLPFFIDWKESIHPAHSAPKGCELLYLSGLHPESDRLNRQLAALGITMKISKSVKPVLQATINTPNGVIILK